jgi:hypothetical protein
MKRIEKNLGGRPPLPEGERRVVVAIRLNPAQRDKLAQLGVERLRAWLDRAKVGT